MTYDELIILVQADAEQPVTIPASQLLAIVDAGDRHGDHAATHSRVAFRQSINGALDNVTVPDEKAIVAKKIKVPEWLKVGMSAAIASALARKGMK